MSRSRCDAAGKPTDIFTVKNFLGANCPPLHHVCIVLKYTSIEGGPGSKFMCRFLRTSKSSCSAVSSSFKEVFPRSLSSLLSLSPDSSSLLPLQSSVRFFASMTSIDEVSSCFPYFFSAF